MADLDVRIDALHLHPIKSCAVVDVRSATLVETGFDLDREYMLVDAAGRFVSQREWPRLALVQPRLRQDDMVLRAPGMLALHVSLERVEKRVDAEVWNDRVAAWDLGDLAAQWFSDFVGTPLRLVRADPDAGRLASREWTGELEAPVAFQDGFPLLVSSVASVAELNRRLALAEHEPVTQARFRPNVVLGGIEANDEDHVDEIRLAGDDGEVVLRLVKPCVRCSIPDVDPSTGETGHAVGDALAAYRADARMEGRLTFGMNAVVVSGVGRTLSVGATGAASYRFA